MFVVIDMLSHLMVYNVNLCFVFIYIFVTVSEFTATGLERCIRSVGVVTVMSLIGWVAAVSWISA